ncbi:calcium-dependent kinase-like protein [Raphidocelis subcapitata]|uniref:Calcium-dependent kinase-like protein n=1 Tax=Raphidocelis subcapitata TaxID=307507 RepID=A0A2V0NSI7_9CHLO|nr:calcium-dependent kinase-like protein [Raphidocelis subcapitata]|eukprot:GBF87805.1 calcium-dependent kinase-like protein [Raphidocelis subcapitata]
MTFGCVDEQLYAAAAPGEPAFARAAGASPAGPAAAHRAPPPPPQPQHRPLARSLLGAPLASDVGAHYRLTSTELGRGAFAAAWLGVERATGRRVAVKSIPKSRLEGLSREWADVRREVQVMHTLEGHPNMVELLGAYEDEDQVHLVMELCAGSCLLERVMAEGRCREHEAAALIRSLLEVLAHAHDLGIAHRDVKLDNLLFSDTLERPSGLKLADWGFAAFAGRGPSARRLHGVCGTSYYIAPEVITGAYDERADVWSAGVVLYVLLCGRPPFCAGKTEDVFREILECDGPDMTGAPWPSISEGAKDAVRQMMTWRPGRRPSAREMLAHDFVRGGPLRMISSPRGGDLGRRGDLGGGRGLADGPAPREPELLRRLRAFSAMPPLKRAAARVIASRLPYDEIRGLRELFASIDADGSGGVSLEELRQALEWDGVGPRLDAGELRRVMAVADADGDGELCCTEFLAAALHPARLEAERNVRLAFEHFDADRDGLIAGHELLAALALAGAAPCAAAFALAAAAPSAALPFAPAAAAPGAPPAAAPAGAGAAGGGGVWGGFAWEAAAAAIDFSEFCSMMRAAPLPPLSSRGSGSSSGSSGALSGCGCSSSSGSGSSALSDSAAALAPLVGSLALSDGCDGFGGGGGGGGFTYAQQAGALPPPLC